MRFGILTVLALALGLTGCGSDAGPEIGNETSSHSAQYTYEFSYNNCSTEKQTFTSLEAMCDGLKSESRNNGCAVSMREGYFKERGCSGSFTLTS